jgi:hypothetical protein
MKNILILVIAILTVNVAFSASYMTKKQQEKYIEKVAKEIRRNFWVQGYDDVESGTLFPSLEQLEEHFAEDMRYENYLDEMEQEDVFGCFYSSTCRLYLIYTSSSFMSGYGETAHFILLDITKRKHEELSHTIYAE